MERFLQNDFEGLISISSLTAVTNYWIKNGCAEPNLKKQVGIILKFITKYGEKPKLITNSGIRLSKKSQY